MALPIELNKEEHIALIQSYVQKNFVDHGMCADVNIHNTGDGNPHAHVMLTVRALDEHGAWKSKQKKDYILDEHGNKQYDPVKKTYKCRTIKTTDWDTKEKLLEWREHWATAVNEVLKEKGFQEVIDHRSYQEQGTKNIPQVHMGPAATAMERKGIQTRLGNINRDIHLQNLAQEKGNQTLEGTEESEKSMLEMNVHEMVACTYQHEQACLTVSTDIQTLQDKKTSLEESVKKIPIGIEKMKEDYVTLQKLIIQKNDIQKEIKHLSDTSTFFKRNTKEIQNQENLKFEIEKQIKIKISHFEKRWEILPKKEKVNNQIKEQNEKNKMIRGTLAKVTVKLENLCKKEKAVRLRYKTDWVIIETREDRQEIEKEFLKLREKNETQKPKSTIQEIKRNQLKIVNSSEKMEILEKLKTKKPKIAEEILKRMQEKSIISSKLQDERSLFFIGITVLSFSNQVF